MSGLIFNSSAKKHFREIDEEPVEEFHTNDENKEFENSTSIDSFVDGVQ